MSLDGYIARPDGAVDFLVNDANARKVMTEFFATIDTAIMGRKTLDDAVRMKEEPIKLPRVLVERLQRRPGKHIFHMGGGGAWTQLSRVRPGRRVAPGNRAGLVGRREARFSRRIPAKGVPAYRTPDVFGKLGAAPV